MGDINYVVGLGKENFFNTFNHDEINQNNLLNTLELIESTPRDWQEKILNKNYIILDLYLYDHSGITMSTKAFSCPWDSGRVGWIYAKRGFEGMSDEQIRGNLLSEVHVYDQYLRSEVYGFVIEEKEECPCCGHIEWNHVDSCCGFYGDDLKENGMLEYIPSELHDRAQKAFDNRFR